MAKSVNDPTCEYNALLRSLKDRVGTILLNDPDIKSITAFAKRIQINNVTLGMFFKGTREIQPKTALKIKAWLDAYEKNDIGSSE